MSPIQPTSIGFCKEIKNKWCS